MAFPAATCRGKVLLAWAESGGARLWRKEGFDVVQQLLIVHCAQGGEQAVNGKIETFFEIDFKRKMCILP